jgi:DNA-binding NtrC family response regulator
MRLMIVGDLGGQLVSASKIATEAGAKVFHVMDVNTALHNLRNGRGADLLMVEVNQDITKLTTSLEQERIHIPVVACGLDRNKEKAIASIEAGVSEYIPLPPNAELIAAVFEAIVNQDKNADIIYSSEKFKAILDLATKIAPSSATVLISGESGTGKEVISRFIHENSKRKKREFISINCAAIPEQLLESELFGHEKGAFTGAIARRIGKFEEANGSTILLDEISEMDLRLQAKLLRAIQEREIERVGGNEKVKLNIRIIATTNRNMITEIKEGRFREDLFYRLNVIHIKLPTLRERKEDIPKLVRYFIEKYSNLNGIPGRMISEAALKKLTDHSWPGNVRELENTIHRAVLIASGDKIDQDAILVSDNDTGTNTSAELAVERAEGCTLASIEKQAISSTIDQCAGNYDKAANVLGISLKVLKQKLKEHKISLVGNF